MVHPGTQVVPLKSKVFLDFNQGITEIEAFFPTGAFGFSHFENLLSLVPPANKLYILFICYI